MLSYLSHKLTTLVGLITNNVCINVQENNNVLNTISNFIIMWIINWKMLQYNQKAFIIRAKEKLMQFRNKPRYRKYLFWLLKHLSGNIKTKKFSGLKVFCCSWKYVCKFGLYINDFRYKRYNFSVIDIYLKKRFVFNIRNSLQSFIRYVWDNHRLI